ncbi:class I SAM-dependent methyltransferase [Marinivivus vitaminiproducens]|uniref:class I SAM-dependent methyltransferase n=1 Tax=Marinivivus vitaminiproducens TaxID=3035935 RepID=UPI0027AAAB8D|nr:class I SAM-dependent methyltransferase [Geminicoccaceae bacterium SCSIO 64248]
MPTSAATRLETFIARMTAQRICIDDARERLAGRPGVVFELGLGNGRTYDHLRSRFPDRDIYVFERKVASHPASRPDPGFLFEGELSDTLPAAALHLAGTAVMVHADLGNHSATANRALFAWLGPVLAPLLADKALVLTDQRLDCAGYEPLEVPSGVEPGRYFYYCFNPGLKA